MAVDHFGGVIRGRGAILRGGRQEVVITPAMREAADHLARQITGIEKPSPHQGKYKRVLRLDI